MITYHYDNARTGQDVNETLLTPSNVNKGTFGFRFSQPVDGFITGQALYLSNVNIPNAGQHNVVYVATLHDSVYAFDADNNSGSNAAPLWHVNFTNPAAGITTASGTTLPCHGVTGYPESGIVSTPVIDAASGTMYVVAKTLENGTVFHRLHALDVDYTRVAEYYKGDPDGGYHAYVFTDALTAKELVDARDHIERDVRAALGIPFNPSASATRYEHSMGQFGHLPANILRRSTADTLAPKSIADVRNRWIPLAER